MKRQFFIWIYGAALWGLLASCGDNGKQVPVAATPPKTPAVMPPFRFHKLIEVSPGQDYDVVSWGRGNTKTGAFAILHSDSAAAKFVTTTGDLSGTIVDAFNTDMDLDGNPEIIIQAKSNDTNNYVNVYAFEYTYDHAEKLDFPHLTKQQRLGYRGQDNFYVLDGKLMREFPLYDAGGKPIGQKRQFEYGMRDNSFTIKQVSKDSLSKAAPVVSSTPKSSGNSSKPKKHHEEPKPKHKKKRRHRSEE